MGMVGRLSHHALVARRRTHRRRPAASRRAPHWPDAMARARLHPPLPHETADEPLSSDLAGQVDVAPVMAAQAPPADSALDMPLAHIGWHEPFHWLALGWRDFLRSPAIGLFYGACFVLMGWVLLGFFKYAPAYTLAMSAGFLLMGPFMCLGLYEASRHLALGEPASFLGSLTAWRRNLGQLAIFGVVLLVLEMIWGRAALIVFAVSFDGMPDFGDSLHTLLSIENLPFIVTYLCVGGFFAGLIYAVSVVSMPMMLDRPVDAISAGLTSLRLVTTQPGVMLMWGALITLIVVLAMLPGFLGLLVAGPVLGHASWHAYKAATALVAQPKP
jgi:uncharacterized membrane protein